MKTTKYIEEIQAYQNGAMNNKIKKNILYKILCLAVSIKQRKTRNNRNASLYQTNPTPSV